MAQLPDTDSGNKKEKDESFWIILSSALELDVKKGHLKWTLSELSRKSGITRSLIYYYFGRSKEEILREAVKLIGEEMVGLSDDRVTLWQRGLFEESMKRTRFFVERTPYIGPFLAEHRGRSTELGESLRMVEDKFVGKLRVFFPKASEDEIIGLFCMYWGMCFSPRISDNAIKIVIRVMQDSLEAQQA